MPNDAPRLSGITEGVSERSRHAGSKPNATARLYSYVTNEIQKGEGGWENRIRASVTRRWSQAFETRVLGVGDATYLEEGVSVQDESLRKGGLVHCSLLGF